MPAFVPLYAGDLPERVLDGADRVGVYCVTVEQVEEDNAGLRVVRLLYETVHKYGGVHDGVRPALGEYLVAHVHEGVLNAEIPVLQKLGPAEADVGVQPVNKALEQRDRLFAVRAAAEEASQVFLLWG